MKPILSAAEIQRNKRVAELMRDKMPRPEEKKLKFTPQEWEEVKELREKGYTREESTKIVLTTNQILNKYK